jgi:hypothetical protein
MRPFFMHGSPGVGKSDTIRQIAADLGVELRDVRATLLDPVDLRGLPAPDGDGGVRWLTPGFLPKSGAGILFLDELNAAPQSTQAACYQLILDRGLGEYRLPDGWLVCAAGNRDTDRAVTNRMPTALSNRLIHFDFDVDVDDWIAWALAADVMTEVIAFIRFRRELLHAFDPTRNEKTFATPRTWQFVSDILKQQPPAAVEFEMIKGTVGEGAAVELMAFLKIFRGLPNPDAVLMTPATAAVPSDPATLYALCGALSRKASEQNMDRLVTYANRVPDEFSVLLIRDAVQFAPGVLNTRGYIEWASAHADVLV